MKRWQLFFSFLFLPLWCNPIVYPLYGEYAEIDSQFEIAELIQSSDVAIAEKQSVCDSICAHPGAYNPSILIYCAEFQLSQGALEQAAEAFVKGVFRGIIDIRASQDATLAHVPTLFPLYIDNALEESGMSPESFLLACDQVIESLEEWDRNTPRQYDRRWASLHSQGTYVNQPLNYLPEEELSSLLEEEYARIPAWQSIYHQFWE